MKLFGSTVNIVNVYKHGDYTGVAPPVPIPNTEVKYAKADDTSFTGKVGSRRVCRYLIQKLALARVF